MEVGGRFVWNPQQVFLYQAQGQLEEGGMIGRAILKELDDKGEQPFSSSLLDYLFRYPELIPEAWKMKQGRRCRKIWFPGTTFANKHGHECVSFMCWLGDGWEHGHHWLEESFQEDFLAAVLQLSPPAGI
jgi:hypothetical protein